MATHLREAFKLNLKQKKQNYGMVQDTRHSSDPHSLPAAAMLH
jgi:hypothetical protein